VRGPAGRLAKRASTGGNYGKHWAGGMKIQDIDRVNHLIAELNGMKELIAHAGHDPADYSLYQAAG
jgi:hypothetical protein